jgi:hypothetical protein
MANALYSPFKQGLLSKQFDLPNDVVKAALVDGASATFSAAHQFLSSISAGVVAKSPALTGKTITDGVFKAAYVTLPGVVGPSVEVVVVYVDKGGADSANPLVGWIDAPAIAYNPNGSDAEIRWSASGIFTL